MCFRVRICNARVHQDVYVHPGAALIVFFCSVFPSFLCAEAARLFLEKRIQHLLTVGECQGVVLACTELGALRSSGGGCGGGGGGGGEGMVFDTTQLHADAAVEFICAS